jgi:hypothetical protein
VSEKTPRIVISLNGEIEPMIDRIRLHMQDNLPEHLKSLRVSKSLAVETALKEYYKRMEAA